jgi:hypothetical protein
MCERWTVEWRGVEMDERIGVRGGMWMWNNEDNAEQQRRRMVRGIRSEGKKETEMVRKEISLIRADIGQGAGEETDPAPTQSGRRSA